MNLDWQRPQPNPNLGSIQCLHLAGCRLAELRPIPNISSKARDRAAIVLVDIRHLSRVLLLKLNINDARNRT